MFYVLLFLYSICAINGSTGLTIFQTVVQQGLCFMIFRFCDCIFQYLFSKFYVLCFTFSSQQGLFFLVILYSPYNSSTRFTFYVLCFVSFVTLFSVSIQQGLCFMFYLLFTTFMLPMLTSNLSTWFSFYTLANPYGNTTRTKFMFYVLPFNI